MLGEVVLLRQCNRVGGAGAGAPRMPALVFDRGEPPAGVHRGKVVATGPGNSDGLGERSARVLAVAVPVQRQAEHWAPNGAPW